MKISNMKFAKICLCALLSSSMVISPFAQAFATEEPTTTNTVFINEIESDDANKDEDWVEIINTGSQDVDLSGWSITDSEGEKGPSEKKPTIYLKENTVIKAGEIVVLEGATDFSCGLGKTDTVNLRDSSKNTVDSFSWQDSHAVGTYSRLPDGTGKFIDQAPTKGVSNATAEKPPVVEQIKQKLVINEVNSSPDDWVEFMNIGTEEMDISGYEIRDNSNDHRWKFADGTKVGAGQLITVYSNITDGKMYNDSTQQYEDAKFDIGLGAGDSVRLYDKEGTILEEYSWTSHASYDGDNAKASFGRYPDGTGDFVLMKETPNEKNDWYVPEAVINEVESNGDTSDWVEIYNKGTTDIDISGWYLLDSDLIGHKADTKPVAEGTILKAGQFFVFDNPMQFNFGLGVDDSVSIFNKSGVLVAKYAWSQHAQGVYARIPDGTGELQDIATSTKGKSNTGDDSGEQPPVVEDDSIDWEGSDNVVAFDKEHTFLVDSSGLDFYNGQLYLIDNDNGTFWVMDVDEKGYPLGFAKGFENGKRIIFKKDVGNDSAKGPDTEGISVDGNGMVYAAVERDNSNKKVNYNAILQVNPNQEGTELVALKEWNITDSLPQVSANMGIESVEWVSADDMNGQLFDQNTNAPFDIKNYPNATANGVFFVVLEDNGHVYAYVLNEDESSVQIADIDSTIGGGMGLDFDTYNKIMYVASDNGYAGKMAKISFNGTATPNVQLMKPAKGVDTNANNEGFAIADAKYTVNGQRPVYRFTDGVETGALTIGSMNCTYTAPVKPTPDDTSSSDTSSSDTSSSDSSSSDSSSTDTSSSDSSSSDTSSSDTSSSDTSSSDTSSSDSSSSDTSSSDTSSSDTSSSDSSSSDSSSSKKDDIKLGDVDGTDGNGNPINKGDIFIATIGSANAPALSTQQKATIETIEKDKDSFVKDLLKNNVSGATIKNDIAKSNTKILSVLDFVVKEGVKFPVTTDFTVTITDKTIKAVAIVHIKADGSKEIVGYAEVSETGELKVPCTFNSASPVVLVGFTENTTSSTPTTSTEQKPSSNPTTPATGGNTNTLAISLFAIISIGAIVTVVCKKKLAK